MPATNKHWPKLGDPQNDQLRPDGKGRPPRPATEPEGAEGSSRSAKTATDPGSGEAKPRR